MLNINTEEFKNICEEKQLWVEAQFQVLQDAFVITDPERLKKRPWFDWDDQKATCKTAACMHDL